MTPVVYSTTGVMRLAVCRNGGTRFAHDSTRGRTRASSLPDVFSDPSSEVTHGQAVRLLPALQWAKRVETPCV
jgi:hypothetical protein